MNAMASEKNWRYIAYHVVSKAKTGLPKHKMVPTHKTTFCNFITENIRRESSHFQELLISLVETDWVQETKN